MLMFTVLLCCVGAAESANEAILLGSSKQLFLDDFVIAEQTNLVRRIHPAEKFEGNPVLWPEEEWEGKVAVVYGSVLQIDGTYRAWYHSGPGMSYAESDDGVVWRKPKLGLVKIDGHDTNVLLTGDADGKGESPMPFFYECFGVSANQSNDDPGRRFILGYLGIQRNYSGPGEDPFHRGERRGLGVAFSPDGIHWTPETPFASGAICDGATHWMFDPARRKYVLYGRTKDSSEDVKAAWQADTWAQEHFWGRAVARIESDDFLNWDYRDPATAPVVMKADAQDPPATEIYSMLVFPYESVYIGLVQRFHDRPDDVFLDVQLAVSHDSVHFERIGDRTPFIPCGQVGEWDRFNNSLANNPPIEVGDELRFYYGGRTYRHSPYSGDDGGVSGGGIGFASVQRDRFVSLGASFDGGSLLTKPLRIQGRTLHLNAKSRFGEIVVEVLDTNGSVIAMSKPVSADTLDSPVTFDTAVDWASSPVQLRITLKNALLFALWAN